MSVKEQLVSVGDIVVYDREPGFLFKVIDDLSPDKVVSREKMITSTRKIWNFDKKKYERVRQTRKTRGCWDVNGKKLPDAQLHGAFRLKCVYGIFAKKLPKNKLVTYKQAFWDLKKVDIMDLCIQYAQLGNLIRDYAVSKGMELPQDASKT